MTTLTLQGGYMTKTNSNTQSKIIEHPHTSSEPLGDDDPRTPMARAVALAGAVIAELDATNETNPSPCPEWDAGHIARHIVAVLDRVAGFPQGIDGDTLPLVVDLPEGADGASPYSTAFTASAHEVQRIWSDDAVLSQMLKLPWAELPGGIALSIYTCELTVHTWDLAQALGVEPQWYEPDVAKCVEVMQFGLPAEPRDDDTPFGPVVEVPQDAPNIDKLVAWVSRQP